MTGTPTRKPRPEICFQGRREGVRYGLRHALLLLLPACFEPTYRQPACSPNGECPSGLLCSGVRICVPPWELVQTVSVTNDRPEATIHVNPLGAGHLVVVALNIDEAGTVKTIADSGASNQYRLIDAGSVQSTTVDASLWLYYVENSRPGADEIFIAATHAVSGVVVWEVAGIRTAESLDAAATLNDQPRSTEPLGPQIMTSAPGDFVVSVALANGTITRMHPGNKFTFDDDGQGNGWSHLTDSRSPAGLYQAQWDQLSAAETCSGAAAFRIGP